MKIQCDVCNKEEASLLCTADEAALCHSYDHLVHHANNLASKHPRFSLLHPSSSKQAPLCDICQEKDPCLSTGQGNPLRDFDVPIHSANQHAHKQNSASLSNGGDSVAAEFKSQPWVKNLAHFNSPSLAMEINKSNGDKVLGSEVVEGQIGLLDTKDIMGMTTDKRWSESDDALTVPQISPPLRDM
ncbi:hypothetical protein J1N35_046183 [Gossypium stocksii]|uniref:B box-type domain-containing protein n=1 Tax=Gossypium stocksii TaxID=47602 RepID=A0A9D3ZE20_9ROSI|nr:hypothetical protein J1N35_046183 [Gossypium stocksii]